MMTKLARRRRFAVLQVDALTVDLPGRRLLDDLELEVSSSEIVAVMGLSGCGKTTLLNCIAGLVVPEHGSVIVDSLDMATAPPAARAAQRPARIGMIFRFGRLLPELNSGDNVALPLLIAGRNDAREIAARWLARVGLVDRYDDSTNLLSGAEVQRVGIARALATADRILYLWAGRLTTAPQQVAR